MNEQYITLSLADICEAVELPEQTFVELIDNGIISPLRYEDAEWIFDLRTVSIARRATRLHRDLDLEWAAIAVIVDLLQERDELRAEVTSLQRRLERFLID